MVEFLLVGTAKTSADDRQLKFNFEHLGVLRCGELNLADLTVITGPNNVGKTYLTYALYGFLANWRRYAEPFQVSLTNLKETGRETIDLDNLVKDMQNKVDEAALRFQKDLSRVLAAEPKLLTNAKVSVAIPPRLGLREASYENSIMSLNGKNTLATITKQSGDNTAVVSAGSIGRVRGESDFVDSLIRQELSDIVFDTVLPRPVIFSTERTGAVTFKGELNFTKNRLFEHAANLTAKELPDLQALLSAMFQSGYPIPVRDNVDFINGLGALSKTESSLAKDHPKLLEEFTEIAGGTYEVDKDDNLLFRPTQQKRLRLRMQESSSSVRALLMFAFYLKHVASAGDLIIMDEPELNLHVENQRKLARFLAKLTRVGIKVLITTHSDTIVREFNALLILEGLGESGSEVRKQSGYANSEGLDAKKFALYTLGEKVGVRPPGTKTSVKCHTIERIEVHPTQGIKRTTFDKTILEMMAVQDRLVDAAEVISDHA